MHGQAGRMSEQNHERCERYNPQDGCGGPFCEHCGDCMICYGEDRCLVAADGKHEQEMTDK